MLNLSWLTKKNAPLPDLQSQHHHAVKAHETALGAVAKAQAAFDATGEDEARLALAKAEEAATVTAAHVARAERLIASKGDLAAAEARSKLVRKRNELRAVIAADTKGEALLRAEVAAVAAVADARDARRAHADEIAVHQHEIHRLSIALGEPVPEYHPQFAPGDPLAFEVMERVQALATGLPVSSWRCQHLLQLTGGRWLVGQ